VQRLSGNERTACHAGSSKRIVLWNLELDTLRGDLGLPAFPPKVRFAAFLVSFLIA
jgi:hypothetical protein